MSTLSTIEWGTMLFSLFIFGLIFLILFSFFFLIRRFFTQREHTRQLEVQLEELNKKMDQVQNKQERQKK